MSRSEATSVNERETAATEELPVESRLKNDQRLLFVCTRVPC